jgi:hypothetical protein
MNDPHPGVSQGHGQMGQPAQPARIIPGNPQPIHQQPLQPPPLRPMQAPMNPGQPRPSGAPLHPSTGLLAPSRPPIAEEPLSLVEETPAPVQAPGAAPAAPQVSKIQAFGVRALSHANETFKRTPNLNKTGAVRVRSFHGRLSEQGLEYMDHQINEWLDNHGDVEIKFVTSTTGIFDGKMKEPAVILNVWY